MKTILAANPKENGRVLGAFPMPSFSDNSRSNNETQMSGMELESPSSSYSLSPPYRVHLTW